MSETQYPIVSNYLLFKELGTDCIGANYRAGEIIPDLRKAEKHHLVTEVYPFLANNPNVWKRINILLEGVKKSNIPKLYSPEHIIKGDEKTLLVYPVLNGKTFEDILDESAKQDNPINFDLAFSMAFAIADLIDVGSSIVVSGEKSFHGFLTPDNILIDYDGKILLKNYGIYPYLSKEEDIFNEMVKKYGAWIAPEFLRREKLVCQTDIYHLGYIIYRILTGKYFSCSPEEDFESKFSNISFSQHIPSNDKEFLTDIITFFKKTLHPQPSQRFANIKEFKDYISNKFHIEELSSVTFNLAYFMNSLYLESMDAENKELEKELTYVIPEKKKKEPAKKDDGQSEHLVQDILTGLDEHDKTSSKSKLILPLIVAVVIIVAVSAWIIINQQKQVKQQAQQTEKTASDLKAAMDKRMKDLESQYQNRLKEIEAQATNTEEEKKAQEEEIKKLKEWQEDEARKAMEKQKKEEERIAAKKKQEEEDIKKQQDAEAEKKRIEEEKKKKQEEEQRKKQEAALKKQQEESQRVKEGQLVPSTEITKKPEKLKGKQPTFSTPIRTKYRGKKFNIRAIILVDEMGNVVSVRMITNPPDELKERIEKAIQKWTYSPAEKDGVKVKVWYPIAISVDL